MRIRLSVDVEDQLLLDLRQYFQIGIEPVRQDMNETLTQTVEIYRRDIERKKESVQKQLPQKKTRRPHVGAPLTAFEQRAEERINDGDS